jgi:type I restriction enzyme S subunit
MKPGWQMRKLEEVCEKITDGSHFSPKTIGEGYPYITVRDIENDQIDFQSCKKISSDDYELLLKNGCKPNLGDLLFSKDGTVGKVSLVDFEKDFVVLSSLAIIRPHADRIDSSFLKYILKSPAFLGEAIGKKTGAAIRRIVLKNLKPINIPVPPLSEQKRIVAILDEAFENIAIAKANAEKNLQNARELFESYLNEVFSRENKGWSEKSLGELGTITSSKRIFKSEYVEAGIPFYRTKEVKELANGRTITTELFISEARYNEIKTNFGVPSEGDILLTAIGTIGEIYVVKGDDDFYFKDGNVLWLKNFDSIKPHFLKYALISFVESLNNLARGSTYNALPIQKLNAHRIFVPSLIEQEAITSQLDLLRLETQRLEFICQQKLASLEALKKSLLHRAFSGEL